MSSFAPDISPSITQQTPVELPTIGRILCCLCGQSIIPNAAAMCNPCLQQQPDFKLFASEIQLEIIQCPKCEKWCLDNALNNWQSYQMESNELLTACMKKIPGMHSNHDVKVLGTAWIWTEPHSRRLKFYVDIERLILQEKVPIQQRVICSYVVKMSQCLSCIHGASEHTWGAMIQFRCALEYEQKGSSIKSHPSLAYVESLLVKTKMLETVSNLEVLKDGLNFYFHSKAQAERMHEFLSSQLPCRSKSSKKLVSQDLQSNTTRFEYTIFMEMIPLCKNDLVLVPRGITGGQHMLTIVKKLSSNLHLLEPASLQHFSVSPTKYFQHPAVLLASCLRHLVPFVILDITPLPMSELKTSSVYNVKKTKGKGSDTLSMDSINSKDAGGILAETIIARESDLGENDQTYSIITHLGHILQAGDIAMGYDIAHMTFSNKQDDLIDQMKISLPDVVLVAKAFPEKEKRSRQKKSNRKAPWRQEKIHEDDVVDEEELDGFEADDGAERNEGDSSASYVIIDEEDEVDEDQEPAEVDDELSKDGDGLLNEIVEK